MTMRTIALVLACLACAVHARRKQNAIQQKHGEDDPSNLLALLLLSVHPTVAFSTPGFQAPSRMPTHSAFAPVMKAGKVGKQVKILLNSPVQGLGKKGDVVNVKPAYAENVLLRQGLGSKATDAMIEEMAKKLKESAAAAAAEKAAATKLAESIQARFGGQFGPKGVFIKMKAGPDGALFGKVSATDIAKALQEAGMGVDAKAITAPKMKTLGTGDAEIKLHKDVTTTVVVVVEKA